MVSKLHRRLRPLRNFLVSRIGTTISRLWISTLRIRWIGDFTRHGRRVATPVPGIYVFWHQRLIGITATCRVGCSVLVSQSSDGERPPRPTIPAVQASTASRPSSDSPTMPP